MEGKTYKPVPDVECLKYHGTPEKPDIKIFVSHRIDLDSETIDNPLYIPVRCGAVYDERENVTMLGDDTGDNISEKRMTYNELTVQYWAWKNVKADYYGLCHYRRYLSFSKNTFPVDIKENKSGLVYESNIKKAIKDCGLENTEVMQKVIQNYDIVTVSPFDERKVANSSIYEMMKSDFVHYDLKALERLEEIIEKEYPEIFVYATQYFKQPYGRMYNLFVSKKNVFFGFCEFEFKILSELENSFDLSFAGKEKQRLLGYLGEHLWGIYVLYLEKTSDVKIKELQGCFIEKTTADFDLEPAFKENNVSVVFSSSDGFAPYLGVALKSLVDSSHKENNYDIVVLEKSISDYQKKKLMSIVESNANFKLRFVNVAYMVSEISFYLANNQELSEETYYTILVPWVLKKYKKSLVLDCDIIIKRDVAELFFSDIDDYYIAAAKEIIYLGFLNNPLVNVNDCLYEYTTEKLKLQRPYDYFQAGVLLIHNEAFRENFDLNGLLQEINENHFNIVEQDLLNKICTEHVKILDYTWNFMSCMSASVIPNLELAPQKEYEKWKAASKNPYIYHYITGMKPWRYPNLEYADIWWDIAKRTPFYETALSCIRSEAVPVLEHAIFDLQCAVGFFDTRTGARKLADKLLPPGSRRRKFAKFLLPKGSLRWRFCKQIYYIFKPQYRPVKAKADEDTED